LFCPGIPGAGKTIITSIVIKHLFDRFQHRDIQGDGNIQDRSIQNEDSVGIAYLYCNFQQQNKQKAEELLASLLKQLAQEHSATVKDLYDRHKITQTRPSSDEISRALQSMADVYSRVFIVVDALDECQISDGGRTRLLSEIFNLQVRSGANIFATSRFIPDITEKFQGSISLEIRASDEDMQRYLDGRILESESVVLKTSREEIKAEIMKAVDGMYVPSVLLQETEQINIYLGFSSHSFISNL
jgi:Cdc6-like AAA superfamily ATPase